MDEAAILASLDKSQWIQQPSLTGDIFLSTVIVFDTEALTGCIYVSSAPISITNPLRDSETAQESNLAAFTTNLVMMAARRLYDMHATNITGYETLKYVGNPTN